MIYFLRHKKTINNQFGLISGQADSPILNENSHIWNGEMVKNIDFIYSSPSKRCLDTLREIRGLTEKPIIDMRLLERNMGDFENCSREELYRQYPDFFGNDNGKIQFRLELTPPNGETISNFSARITSFCEEIIIPNMQYNILICSHNQVMKMIYFLLEGIYPSQEEWTKISFPNGKFVVYSFRS